MAEPGRSRDNPAPAKFVGRRLLNKGKSEKETWHIDFDLSGCGLDYVVGDSFGIFARNDLGNVDQIIALLGASHTTKVRGKTLREVLLDDVSLAPAPDSLFELISYLTGGTQREKARALAQGEDPDGDAATLDVMAVLQKFPNVRPHPEAFIEALEALQPRLYSISSSHNATPGKLSLTVDCVRYLINKRKRLGLASTFLAERIQPGDEVKVYVQKAHGFALPEDPKVPIIMIGPGTGIAPFRAFLHDRRATGAPGKNWLFFGHQRSDCDFFYADELNAMKTSGLLTRLSLAWSRDGDKKFYVQDRMREVGREVWTWLAEGANIYICGDAKRMAKDVERALVDIVAQFGARTTDEAVLFCRGTEEERPIPAGRLLIPGLNQLKSARIKFSVRLEEGEFSSRIGVRRSVRITISETVLNPPANDIPYAAPCCVGDRPCANYRRKPACTFTHARCPAVPAPACIPSRSTARSRSLPPSCSARCRFTRSEILPSGA